METFDSFVKSATEFTSSVLELFVMVVLPLGVLMIILVLVGCLTTSVIKSNIKEHKKRKLEQKE